MYDDGQQVMVGDIVRRGGEEGEILKVEPNGLGGQENALIQWSGIHEIAPGIRGRKAPVQDLTKGLRLVRRKL
jgi:hypothetical protein